MILRLQCKSLTSPIVHTAAHPLRLYVSKQPFLLLITHVFKAAYKRYQVVVDFTSESVCSGFMEDDLTQKQIKKDA